MFHKPSCSVNGRRFVYHRSMSQSIKSVKRSAQGGLKALGMAEGNQWDPKVYNENARFVHDLAGPVLELLDPKPGSCILDLGCGEGSIGKNLKDMGCKVIGVDASQAMVDATLALGVEAYRMDGHDLTYEQEFDAVFSNAAIHWMSRDPVSVISGVRRALKPGGRFVAEFGGHGNIAAIITAMTAVFQKKAMDPDTYFPWYFPSAEEYRSLLEQEGFEVESIQLIPRPTSVPTGIVGWLKTFTVGIFKDLSESEQSQVLSEIETLLKPGLQRWDGTWTVDYVRLRFKANLRK